MYVCVYVHGVCVCVHVVCVCVCVVCICVWFVCVCVCVKKSISQAISHQTCPNYKLSNDINTILTYFMFVLSTCYTNTGDPQREETCRSSYVLTVKTLQCSAFVGVFLNFKNWCAYMSAFKFNAGTSGIGTINSNNRIAETLYSLGTWFISGIYVMVFIDWVLMQ